MKEALNGSTHRYFPAATWVGRARRSLPKMRTTSTQVRVQVRRGYSLCGVYMTHVGG